MLLQNDEEGPAVHILHWDEGKNRRVCQILPKLCGDETYETLTERANYPFEGITMDFAEFTKNGESFIVMSDKYSGALHAGGVKKGGTGDETINNVVNFARSNVGNIKKIVSDMGTQFTGATFQKWIEKNGITHTTSSAYRPDNNQAAEGR